MDVRQLVFTAKGQLDIEYATLPHQPEPGDVLIEQRYGLISPGTELAILHGDHSMISLPYQPGYAAVGSVIAVGEGVRKVTLGQTVYTRGKHASHALVPEADVWTVPATVPEQHAPFAALAGIALTAIRTSEMQLGYTVAVLGLGLVGNFAAQLMQQAGALEVIAVDGLPHRLTIAQACGMTETLLAGAGLVQEVRARTHGHGCHVVVDATGAADMLPVAIEMATKKGMVVLLGSPHGDTSYLRLYDLHKRGITIVGAQAPLQPYMIRVGEPHLLEPNRLMLDFMSQDRLRIAPLMTHTYDAGRAAAAYAGLTYDKEAHLGVLLDLQKW